MELLNLLLAIIFGLMAMLIVALVIIDAVHHGHDGVMVATGVGVMGTVAGWTGRKLMKG